MSLHRTPSIRGEMRERIVEELIYERVRLDEELHAMLELERDLGDSLRRAIAEATGNGDPTALADRCIARVFRRLALEEFDELEGEIALQGAPPAGGDDDDDDDDAHAVLRVVSPAVARDAVGRRGWRSTG